jgi:hypothetical protein
MSCEMKPLAADDGDRVRLLLVHRLEHGRRDKPSLGLLLFLTSLART